MKNVYVCDATNEQDVHISVGDQIAYFFLRSCEHFGQNHLPFGFVVKPTQAKWNHSMGHCNGNNNKIRYTMFPLYGTPNFHTNLGVIASNHFSVWYLLAHAISGFVWIDRHIENVTRMWCCVTGWFGFWLFGFCRFLYFFQKFR